LTVMKKLTLTVSNDCLLEGLSFDLETVIKKELTIDNPKYTAAKRYGRWVGKKIKPQLKYYDPVPSGIRFPRGYSNQAVLLCRKHEGTSPQIIDNRRSLDDVVFNFSGELREYQQRAVEAFDSHSFGVLEAGTGSGKTIMALALIALRRQPTLIVVHTKELLYQWRERIKDFLQVSSGLIGDGHSELGDITVAIVNSARKKVEELAPQFGHLVVDECHRVPAALFTDVVSAFDSKYLLGLSATAFRSDDQLTRLIYFYMGDAVYKVDQDELAAAGAIVKPRFIAAKTDFTFRYRGDYQALISALTTHEGRNRQIIDDVALVAAKEDGGTALVVSDRVSHCEVFKDLLQKRGIRVALLTGQTPAESRSSIVAAVQKGELQVLVATLQLISEGFDCPGLSSLFLTTPISFEGRLVQVIGRIMRPAKNKQARVYDYLDNDVSALRKSANIRHKILKKVMEPVLFPSSGA
jgi:superfamily II DNA or RNA helicase